MTAYQQIQSNKRRSVLLIAGFIVFIVLLGWFISYLYDAGPGGIALAVILSISLALFSYFGSDKVALWTSGAQGPISKEDNTYLYRLVENVALTAGLPVPKIYLIQDPSPNAFATGRDPQHASVAFTTGIIDLLENEELEGVVAHELSHIKNYDTRLKTVVIICVGIVSILANVFLRFGGFQGRSRNSNNNVGWIFALIGIVLLLVSPIISKLIQLAISRKREFLADASGVLLTRYPEGLARALEKISQSTAPLQRANTATAHLYITNPFGSGHRTFRNLFSTHPPIGERTKALRSMA